MTSTGWSLFSSIYTHVTFTVPSHELVKYDSTVLYLNCIKFNKTNIKTKETEGYQHLFGDSSIRYYGTSTTVRTSLVLSGTGVYLCMWLCSLLFDIKSPASLLGDLCVLFSL